LVVGSEIAAFYWFAIAIVGEFKRTILILEKCPHSAVEGIIKNDSIY
jgi:hypothetical protein